MSGKAPFTLRGRNPDVLTCIANQTGVNLSEAFERNLQKKTRRDGERHHRNPKLNP